MPSKQQQPTAPAPSFSPEELVSEPLKAVLSMLEKKVRNMEKRKLKLKEYEKKIQAGTKLTEEQKKAAGDLIVVEHGLLTIADMQKTISTMQTEYTKLTRKEEKRAKIEADKKAQQKEVEICQKSASINAILSAFSDEARQDMLAEGLLSEEELEILDQAYGILNPVDTEAKVSEITERCSLHMRGIIAEADTIAYEEVTHKRIAEIISKIQESGYFEEEHAVVVAVPEIEAVEETLVNGDCTESVRPEEDTPTENGEVTPEETIQAGDSIDFLSNDAVIVEPVVNGVTDHPEEPEVDDNSNYIEVEKEAESKPAVTLNASVPEFVPPQPQQNAWAARGNPWQQRV